MFTQNLFHVARIFKHVYENSRFFFGKKQDPLFINDDIPRRKSYLHVWGIEKCRKMLKNGTDSRLTQGRDGLDIRGHCSRMKGPGLKSHRVGFRLFRPSRSQTNRRISNLHSNKFLFLKRRRVHARREQDEREQTLNHSKNRLIEPQKQFRRKQS